MQLPNRHIWQVDNGIQHLHGGPGTFPSPETVGYQDIYPGAEQVSRSADDKGGQNLYQGKFCPAVFGTAEDVVCAGLVIGCEYGRCDDGTEEHDQKGKDNLVIHGIGAVSREELIGFFHCTV